MRISRETVLGMLRYAVESAGSQSALARKWKVGQTYISQVLNGTQRPGPKLCRKLGVVVLKEWTYTMKDK